MYKNPLNNYLLENKNDYSMQSEVDKWLEKLDLLTFKDQQTQNLSGGVKRRLSVAIALIGGSKLVILDEPSSGMDLTSRYQLWDILKEVKKDRIIILTTHYMDEAEQLGDRIAIMGDGRIRCCGTGTYLKSNYGGGYKLSCEKSDPNSEKIINFIKN